MRFLSRGARFFAKSRHTAISRLFVRAIPSLRPRFVVSILALSVIALRCHSPGCGTQRLLRCRLHPAGRCPNSSSLFPLLAAVVAVAPKGEPLACRATFRWMPKARQGAKERASLTGAAASEQERLVKLL